MSITVMVWTVVSVRPSVFNRFAQRSRRDVVVAVVRDLVTGLCNRSTGAFIRIDGDARNKPGGLNAALLEQPQETLGGDDAKLAARNRRWARLPGGEGLLQAHQPAGGNS